MARSSSNRSSPSCSPKRLGYRMPAEWEPHRASWLSWPHNPATWTEGIESVYVFFNELVAAIAADETVHINVRDAAMESLARSILGNVPVHPVHFHHFPTNDAWVRDHGAIMVVSNGANDYYPDEVAIDWGFNAWGGKYPPYDLDDAIPVCMARILQVPCISGGMVLEGGSIDVNGKGDLLTTTACLLNPNRNPELDQPEIELRLKSLLGTRKIHWLDGEIAGDDTDGHIDNLARFVNATTIVAVSEDDPQDVNYESLQNTHQKLGEIQLSDGSQPRVVPLPMPDPVHSTNGDRLPASYANFYITNRTVIVPQFGQEKDREACKLLASLFQHRRIVGIDCRNVIVGLGAIHCLTQQVPRRAP